MPLVFGPFTKEDCQEWVALAPGDYTKEWPGELRAVQVTGTLPALYDNTRKKPTRKPRKK